RQARARASGWLGQHLGHQRGQRRSRVPAGPRPQDPQRTPLHRKPRAVGVAHARRHRRARATTAGRPRPV
ncbi:MAG: hypothetical protein AVDCRST_MAG50-2568, partial [uncultured Acidimicrobiales bacterium]